MHRYNYVNGDPINNIDPTGLDCVAVGDTVTCNVPSGPVISFPRPKGWPDVINSKSKDYHYYDKSSSYIGNKGCLEKRILQRPTPGYPNPAKINGAANNATPEPWNFLGVQNPVVSYVQSHNGQQVIVNVTQPGHNLWPGYVARTVDGNTIHNFGEGTGRLQAPRTPDFIKNPINNEWYNAISADKKACGCE